MRPNTLGSLRWIMAVLLLSGCYRPMYQQGYGYNGYGNAYQGGYGGYQGIQTLTPGQYYAPGAVGTPTYAPNGIQPEADPNNSGNGSGGGAGDGGDAPPAQYNPETEEPVRPAPPGRDPFYKGDGTGSDTDNLEEPTSEPKLNDSGAGSPSAMSEPAASEEWAEEEPIQQTGLKTAERPLDLKATETEEEVPPLTSPGP